MKSPFGSRRAIYIDISEFMEGAESPLTPVELRRFDTFDLYYRSLCALMYNYVPMSGHPGGSISSGRIVMGILFDAMDYDVSRPARDDADIVSYAAGHKALGLYNMWALRDEMLRIAAPALLPSNVRERLRLEDLLGFRRNPVTSTPLFRKFGAKALDGHPTPATPFVRLSTGASGVGLASSLGLAFAAKDYYGQDAPRVHIVEGEGGLTPGRAAEALASAGTSSLGNAVLHVDWNQASIDTERVCRLGDTPGDYVQWNPAELAYLNDWNVIFVPDGIDFQQVLAAQRRAASLDNGQPTAIVYRTVKGWRYGIEGRASHGAGHKLCSNAFHQSLAELTMRLDGALPACEGGTKRCDGPEGDVVMEECFFEALTLLRGAMEKTPDVAEAVARRLSASRERLDARKRKARPGAPVVDAVYGLASDSIGKVPAELALAPGTSTTLRAELARALGHYNKISGGSMLTAAADLLGSTSVNLVGDGFPTGYWNAHSNPGARTLSTGGICEDAMSGILAGISTFGRHIGVGSSYGAFLAPLGHIAARLHAIGNQAACHESAGPYRPMILVCAHAGLKTGEDGPTHADPQPLQLLQENFPRGTVITLTPWDPAEIWTLLAAALAKRPAVIAPFVTRPNETVLDRVKMGFAPASEAARGLYLLRAAKGKGDATIVLQESGVTYAFIQRALPRLLKDGLDPNVYYVASAELFDLLPEEEQRRIFPQERAMEAIGITGFTLATMYRWVRSEHGRARTLHPFMRGRFLGSGQADKVLLEAGLDGDSQYRAIIEYLRERKTGEGRKAERRVPA